MNRKCILMIFMALISAGISAEAMLIAPLVLYDEEGKKLEEEYNPAEAICTELMRYQFDGLLNFSLLAEGGRSTIYTIADANKACIKERAEYMLYGYAQKNEGSWLANIKLYSLNEKKIIKQFYSSDDTEHYERFIRNLTANILDGLEELTGLNQDRINDIDKKTHPLKIKIPVSLFYWSPIDKKWNEQMLGIAGADLAVELEPRLPHSSAASMFIDFSIRLHCSWSYAMNQKNAYPFSQNGILAGLPVFVHLHFNPHHSVYAGLGLYYELEIMSIRPKYENSQLLYQNIFGIETALGYEFAVNNFLNLFTELTCNFHLNNDRFISLKPSVGASFTIY